ncbi:MAG TPA: helix-turn-helix domain-containing protein [Chloroflexota bacterium]|nr:helix-turn-helix domain-containing protein [Chloroflexota bacterium]
MSRRQKEPLRVVTDEERTELTRLSRAQGAPAAVVARARGLLAVADGESFLHATHRAGRRHGETVATWVARFNAVGLAAVEPRHGGGQRKRYTTETQERILREARRPPDRDQDGTASWSLSTLQRAVRQAPDGLPTVSRSTLWAVLRDGGLRWGKDRSWCETGTAVRKRKNGTVTVTDPDATPQKT